MKPYAALDVAQIAGMYFAAGLLGGFVAYVFWHSVSLAFVSAGLHAMGVYIALNVYDGVRERAAQRKADDGNK